MKDNHTNQLCDICNSHISVYRTDDGYIYECTYCGEVPEDIVINRNDVEDYE